MGLKYGGKVERTYRGMLSRCYYDKSSHFQSYGGRGITVCDRWRESIENFYLDMGDPPRPQHSLDRIDVNGNYEPGNCRWATFIEQANNTRRNRRLTHQGESLTITGWARKMGVSKEVLLARLRLGWDTEKVLSTPLNQNKTICKRGHLLTAGNIKKGTKYSCRQCKNLTSMLRGRAKRRSAAHLAALEVGQ
jgi:hypothetical protein